MKIIFAVSLVACVVGCTTGSSSPTVSAVVVTPSPCGVGHASSVQMTATATLPNGTKEDVTSSATWTSGNTQTATVNPSGVVVGVNAGITGITATFEGATGTVDCTVAP